jgi:hypothetical protein
MLFHHFAKKKPRTRRGQREEDSMKKAVADLFGTASS